MGCQQQQILKRVKGGMRGMKGGTQGKWQTAMKQTLLVKESKTNK
jgi:hypothetical protein